MQLCSMDRSLSESAASYYSPYKLKPSMEGREAHSTSCSFGMMAFLAKLRETMSPCARIITYQTDSRFHSAAHALQVAAALEKRGDRGERAAMKIRQYVETVRQKYVLIDTIANHWCPGVWTAAKAKPGATCDVPRVAAWTEEGAKLAEAQEAAEKASGGRSPGGRKSGGRKGGRQPKDGRGFEEAGNQGLLDDLDARMGEAEGALQRQREARMKRIEETLGPIRDEAARLSAALEAERRARKSQDPRSRWFSLRPSCPYGRMLAAKSALSTQWKASSKANSS